jgi:hypothetical protein
VGTIRGISAITSEIFFNLARARAAVIISYIVIIAWQHKEQAVSTYLNTSYASYLFQLKTLLTNAGKVFQNKVCCQIAHYADLATTTRMHDRYTSCQIYTLVRYIVPIRAKAI